MGAVKGCVVVNAYAKDSAYLYQATRMKAEFEKLGAECDILKNELLSMKIGSGKLSVFDGYDFVVFWDKDKYLLAAAEKAGVRTFNSRRAIEICDDKVLTYIALSGEGLPLAETIAAPLCYTAGAEIAREQIDGIVDALGLPLVVKKSYGSLGNGVYLAGDRTALETLSDELMFTPHLYQKYMSSSYGSDIRIIAVGDKILGAMKRTAHGDFRSNIGAGGTAATFEPTREMREITLKAKALIGLDYCGIDLLFDPDGKPVICEVNSNAFFETFERVTGVNVAKAYAEYVLNTTKK